MICWSLNCIFEQINIQLRIIGKTGGVKVNWIWFFLKVAGAVVEAPLRKLPKVPAKGSPVRTACIAFKVKVTCTLFAKQAGVVVEVVL